MPRASTPALLAATLVVAAALPVTAVTGLAVLALEDAHATRVTAEQEAMLLTAAARVRHHLDVGAEPAEALRAADAPPGAFLLAPDGARTHPSGREDAAPALAAAIGTRVTGVLEHDGVRYAWARVPGVDAVLVAPVSAPGGWAAGRIPMLVAGAALTVTGLGVAALVFTRERVTKPLGGVAAAARAFAGGDRAARAPVSGPAEVAELAHAFNETADRLASEESALEAANARLDALAESRRVQLVRAAEDVHRYRFTLDHELREPLRSMDTLLGLWLSEVADAVGSHERDVLDRVRARTRRLQRVILDLQELDAWADRDLTVHDVHLDACVDAAVERVQELAHEKNALVERVDALPVVGADAEALTELFARLLENGIRFNDASRPVARVRLLDVDETGTAVHVAVDDNGIGIPEDRREEVVHAFRRLHPPGRFGEGTGIGLAIARRIADAHGGALAIRESPDGGTRVVVTLPFGPERPVEKAPGPRAVREF